MHFGIVITDTQIVEDVVRNYVLELIEDGKNGCYYALARVGHSAFRLDPNVPLGEATLKNQKRRAEKPLSFGDGIKWEDKDVMNRIILKIHRVQPFFEPRVSDGKSQILVTGVVSPIDKYHFWSQYFQNIRLDEVSSQCVLPNIAVSAWLNVWIDSSGEVCIEFDSFHKVEPDNSSMVASAPWNHNNSKYTTLTVPFSDDGLINCIVLPESYTQRAKWQSELLNREGVYTGDRLIFCKEFFTYEIVIALINPSKGKNSGPLVAGNLCDFSAVWNGYEKKFIVTNYTDKGSKAQLSSDGFLRTSLKAEEKYPGVFRSANFGLIDDPRGVLSLFHLSDYKNSSVVVTIEDKPSKSKFRFRIVDVQADKAPKLQKWVENSKIAVEKVDGVIVDESTVYSKDHGDIFFHLSEDLRENALPGKLVKFSARYQYETKQFTVTEIFSMSEKVEIVSVEKRLLPDAPHELQRAFQISAARSVAFDCFLEHDIFGLIDVGTHILPTNRNSSSVLVWVMRSPPDSNEGTRSARTPFVVVSVRNEEPDEVALPEDNLTHGDTKTLQPVSEATSVSEYEEPFDAVRALQKISAMKSDYVMREAMKHMGLTENKDLSAHLITCTGTNCEANCPTLAIIILIMDKVPHFTELLAAENPSLYKRCLNLMFN